MRARLLLPLVPLLACAHNPFKDQHVVVIMATFGGFAGDGPHFQLLDDGVVIVAGRTFRLSSEDFDAVKSMLLSDEMFALPDSIERVPRHASKRLPNGNVRFAMYIDVPEQCLYLRRGQQRKRICVFPAGCEQSGMMKHLPTEDWKRANSQPVPEVLARACQLVNQLMAYPRSAPLKIPPDERDIIESDY